MKKIIDLSQVIENSMPVYPGDNIVELMQDKNINSDQYNNFSIHTSMHVGTHMDTPMHMIDIYKTVDTYSVDHFYGNGVIINAYQEKVIKYKPYYEDLIHNGDIVFIYTGFEIYYGTPFYYENYPVLSLDFGDFLVNKNVKIVGMDTPSPDYYPFEVHKLLLKENIFIIENLCNLAPLLKENNFEVFAFPLKIKADASLLRVVARIND